VRAEANHIIGVCQNHLQRSKAAQLPRALEPQ
jgi:hypothetical protein